MPKYCKAYQLSDVRQFAGWSSPETEEASDDELCFVWEDFKVTKSCFDEDTVIFPGNSSEWQQFCKDVLNFAVPDDLKTSVS